MLALFYALATSFVGVKCMQDTHVFPAVAPTNFCIDVAISLA